MAPTTLIVDDDRIQRRFVGSLLRQRLGLDIQEAENGEHGLTMLANDAQERIKLIILDLNMPIMPGMPFLKIVAQRYKSLPVIVLTGTSDVSCAVEAMKVGAVDFLSKPLSTERMISCVRDALKMGLLRKAQRTNAPKSNHKSGFMDLIGGSVVLDECIKIGKKAALTNFPVLISGETGTGKEIFARSIHSESARHDKPFIAVNCGAIPEKLVESTLFGHMKGAFTGAVSNASGKFQEADGGTIFLDEIGELPLSAQVKLLRVLQQKEIEPVGASRPVRVDVRIISATNRDLSDEVRQERFRQDLFYRLNVLHIFLPPLRERKDDLLELIMHILEESGLQNANAPRSLTDAALAKLQSYTWPGNIRELENVINRALALSTQQLLDADDFHLSFSNMPLAYYDDSRFIQPLAEDGSFKTMQILEREIINRALAHHGHNVTKTASALGMAKSTLYTKIAK